MTYAPDSIKTAQKYLHEQTGLPWAALGIVGDSAHDGGYHCGDDRVDSDDYSVDESARDRRGLSNAASALDIGNWSGLQAFSRWLVAECERGAADTLDIREVIYSPDGRDVDRWDRLGIRSSGDSSHRWHTHISWFRDSERRDKAGLFRRYFEGGHASVAPSVPTGTYREGDSGWGVERLQAALNDAIDAGLAVDGDYGPKTTAAVRELQRRAGITIDGVYGDDSEAALRDLLEEADMPLTDTDVKRIWGYTNERLTDQDAYEHLRNPHLVKQVIAEQAKQTALLKQTLAAASGISEESIAAAVAEGVARAMPDTAELAAAVAAAVDHDLDTAAVEAALRSVLGGVDEAAQ